MKNPEITKMDAITVKYIYSACIKTTTPDVIVLHDPWFTEGIYDGAWYHFPKMKDPLKSIGDVDYIYISHIHPDHFDVKFILHYFEYYGHKKVIIADHQPNFLAGKMRAYGIEPIVLSDDLVIGSTRIQILPHRTGSQSDIDSAILIKYIDKSFKPHCVVNANDIIFNEKMTLELCELAGDVDILLCGYTGAGPYPQTYYDEKDPLLPFEAVKKKKDFFKRYLRITSAIGAKVNIPFAGKYILGGRLSQLNASRGVADPVEVLTFDNSAIILDDDGGEINTDTLVPTKSRTIAYSKVDIERRIHEIKDCKLDYEKLFNYDEVHQLPLKRLLTIAARNARLKSDCEVDYYFCIEVGGGACAVINANKNAAEKIYFRTLNCALPEPRSLIKIDPRYLFGLLTHVYHWNNAEVGSLYYTRRMPNVLNREAQRFLNFLSV